jgi:hypothetical protein
MEVITDKIFCDRLFLHWRAEIAARLRRLISAFPNETKIVEPVHVLPVEQIQALINFQLMF